MQFCVLLIVHFLTVPASTSNILGSLRRQYEINRYKEQLAAQQNENDSNDIGVSTRYFEDQRLDHYSYNSDTWTQQYFVFRIKDRSMKTDPEYAFLCIGGEWDVTRKGMCYEFIGDLLPTFENSIGFALEHRFYGQSQPTGDLSLSSLRYLNANQALADLAFFIEKIVLGKYKVKHPPIIIGCSYAGSLSTWFRLKYPHLAFGAVALSPPLKARVDFPEYLEVSKSAGEKLDEKCVNKLPSARQELLEAVKNREIFESKLNLCRTNLDTPTLFYAVVETVWLLATQGFMINAQWGADYIKEFCDVLENSDIFEAAKSLISMDSPGSSPCFDAYYVAQVLLIDARTQQKMELGMETDVEYRPWYWQKCSEFGFFKTNLTTDEYFMAFPIDDFLSVCESIFVMNSSELYSAVERTNMEFGALNVDAATRLLVINGELDPWRAASLPKRSGSFQSIVSEVIEAGHHCPSDQQSFKIVVEAVKNWIGNTWKDNNRKKWYLKKISDEKSVT